MINNLFMVSIVTFAQASRTGTVSECLTGEDVQWRRIDTPDYPMSYEMTLDAGDGCYFLAYNTAFAVWKDGTQISAALGKYRPPKDGETECQEEKTDIPYYSGNIQYTSNSGWPYRNRKVCAWLFAFWNNSASHRSQFRLYTNDANTLLVSAVSLTLATLLF